MMKRFLVGFLSIFILSACSQDEDDEMLLTQNVKIPSTIFTSEKQNSEIDEEEMKVSIQTYLDSSEELLNASEPFQEILYEDEELSAEELEKFSKINKLTKENDENFANYILHNTLPEGYQEESERISQYITAVNEMLYEIDEMVDHVTTETDKGVISKVNATSNIVTSITSKFSVVNGKEQKKIENFLDKKNIDTKAFGR